MFRSEEGGRLLGFGNEILRDIAQRHHVRLLGLVHEVSISNLDSTPDTDTLWDFCRLRAHTVSSTIEKSLADFST